MGTVLTVRSSLLHRVYSQFGLANRLGRMAVGSVHALGTCNLSVSAVRHHVTGRAGTDARRIRSTLSHIMGLGHRCCNRLSSGTNVAVPLRVIATQRVRLVHGRVLSRCHGVAHSLNFTIRAGNRVIFHPVTGTCRTILSGTRVGICSNNFAIRRTLRSTMQRLTSDNVHAISCTSN